jgi:hypothetical protein
MKLRLSSSAAIEGFAVSFDAQRGGAEDSKGNRAATALSLVLLLIALWLATRPYIGVVQDARFYAIQALSALTPGRFGNDLYFRYGSQDQFTAFTLVYEPVLAALGLARAAMVLTIAGQVLWLAGLIYLAHGLFRNGRVAYVAVVMAVALSGGVFFHYGEQYLTPRLFAEALTLWALGAMLRGRPLIALAVLCLSTTVHPLMTLPGLAFLFLHEAAGRRAPWMMGAAGIIAAVALAWLGVQPFARLTETFDPAWFAVVRVRDFFGLIGEWRYVDWFRVLGMAILAALGLTVADPRERRFLLVALAVAFGGIAVTWIGGDLLHNVLVVDIQQYRATWLLVLTANLFVGPLLLRMPKSIRTPLTRAALLWAVALLAMASFIVPAYVFATSMLVLGGLAYGAERVRQKPLPAVARVLFGTIAGLFFAASAGFIYHYFFWIGDVPAVLTPVVQGIALTVAVLGAIAVQMTAPIHVRRALARWLATFSACLAAVAVLIWDQRTPWTTFVETTEVVPKTLAPLLPEHGQIYWEGDVRFPWFVLRRPNYFSCPQGTGALFFRATALTYQHRYDSFRQLQPLDFGQETTCPLPPAAEGGSFSRLALVSVCADEPDLGALVLTRPVSDTPGTVWVAPVPFEDIRPKGLSLGSLRTDRFYIYSCADLR